MYLHEDLVGLPPEALLRIRRKPASAAAATTSPTAAPAHPPRLPRTFPALAASLPADAKRARVEARAAGAPFPFRRLEAFTGIDTARPRPLAGGPVTGASQFLETAHNVSDSFESGLLLSFLEASDAGAIAPSLLSQLAGSERFGGGDADFTPASAADAHFTMFGKRHAFAADAPAAPVVPPPRVAADGAPGDAPSPKEPAVVTASTSVNDFATAFASSSEAASPCPSPGAFSATLELERASSDAPPEPPFDPSLSPHPPFASLAPAPLAREASAN